ncbi:MAG: protein translocase subunit SecF [Alphaproteobacteria bacterium]|nr:MAG: protein translocase subunit SecF [Alphaproteobacteria bacterium]
MLPIHLIPQQPNINFLRYKWIAVGLTLFLTLASIFVVSTKGLSYGIDFSGGIMMEVAATDGSKVDLAGMREHLNSLSLGEVALQEFGKENHVLIRVQQQKGGQAEQMAAVQKVRESLGAKYDFRRVEFVGPKVGDELVRDSTIAVLLSMAGIMLYIWFRFEWQYGVNALIAAIYDVVTTLGIYSLFNIEFNLTSIAALLTLAGYSINDKVVVYDRIRENLRKYKKMPMEELLNLSVNQTLARSVMTSVTVFLAVLALLFFGGEVIRGFNIAMTWGVLVAMFSSVYVAAPLILWMMPERKETDPETNGDRYQNAA